MYSNKQKEAILKKAIKAAKDEKLFFINYVVAHLPISNRTFYEWKFHESQELKDILEENAIKKKTLLLKKWEDSPNATLQIALFKLLATSDERKVLADRQVYSQDEEDNDLIFEGWD